MPRSLFLGASLLCVALAINTLPASAVVPPANSGTKVAPLSPGVDKLLKDAAAALKAGNLDLALIQLRNAVRLAPQNGSVRAQLGQALLRSGAIAPAGRELRQARSDGGPDDIIVPAILEALLIRGQSRELLDEFPEPAAGSYSDANADIFRSRASALQALGRTAEANAEMDRALSLRRDARSLIARGTLAIQQGDLALARRLGDEATKLSPDNEDVMVFNVMLLRQGGDLHKALDVARQYAARLPDNPLARALVIEVLFQLKQDSDAKVEIDALLADAPHSSLGGYYSALLAARANDPKGAWHEAQNLQPEFVLLQPDIAITVARMALASGNMETGGAILAAVVSRRPEVGAARLQLAAVQLAQRNPDLALKTLDPLKSSEDPRVQALLGQAYLQLSRFGDAIQALGKASAGNAENSDLIKRQLALLQLQGGNSEKAIQGLQQLATRDPGEPDTSGALIAALVQSGKLNEALDIATSFGQAASKSALPEFYRGRIFIEQGDLPNAFSAFGRAIAIDPKFVPAYYYRAIASAARGNPDAANADLRQVLAQDPGNIAAYIKLSEIALNSDHEPESVALLRQAIKIAPVDPTPRLALVNYQFDRGKYDDAMATVNALLQISPNHPEGLALQGQIQLAKGNPERAIETFRWLTATNSRSPASYVLLAKSLNDRKDRLAAIDAAREAVELTPQAPPVQATLIETLVAAGRTDEALRTARDYGSKYPGPQADVLLANTLIRLKRLDEANAMLAAKFAAKPERIVAIRLSQIAVSPDQKKKAGSVLAAWLQKNPEDFDARRQYASLLLATGDKAARTEYEALLKKRPEDAIVLNNLGWILQKDDAPRALALLTLAAKIEPRSPKIVDTLGWIKFQRQDHQGALPLFQRAHELSPADGEIGYHLSLALNATGKRGEAKTLLQTVLAKNPRFSDLESAKQALASW
jgi:putative PEP-CTERM system TPR-repeat lipoprotein